MKNLIKILFFTGIITAVACEDFLDRKPISDFTSEPAEVTDTVLTSQYKNLSDAQSGLNGAYNNFKQDIYQFEIFMYNEVQSDNCYAGGDGVAEAEEDDIRMNAMNSKTSMMFAQYYVLAGTATSVIENTRMMPEGSIDSNSRSKIIAEAKFIRAYAYFDIVRIWGDAPMVLYLLPPITADNLPELYPLLYPARTAADSIYTRIVADLNEAIPYLDSKSSGEFKATKGAAYGLLAKVTATRGEKTERDYNAVAEYCDNVIAEGYQLVANFDDMWNPDNDFTTESIFEIYFTTEAANWAYWVLFSEDDGSVTWRRYCTPTHDLLAKYTAQDQRLPSTVRFRSVPYDTYYPADNYPIANKIRRKDSEIILMRLADIMLLKAEALVELNRISEAISIVNTIRTRAGIAALDSNMPQDDARLAVETERQLELMMEGHRWFDLLRNNRMVSVMRQHKNKNGQPLFPDLEEYHSLWPIPQGERDMNPSLTQNPGY